MAPEKVYISQRGCSITHFWQAHITGRVVSTSQKLTKYAVWVPSRKDNKVLDIIEMLMKQLAPTKQPELVISPFKSHHI